ncbi:MAG TPA: DUF3108 domain-containing protein [Bacteroidota bacterium]
MSSPSTVHPHTPHRSATSSRRRAWPGAEQSPQPDYSLTMSDYLLIAALWVITVALRYFLIILFVVGTTNLALAQAASRGSVFAAGETLQYKVKWGFFRLGTIVITQQPCTPDGSGRCLLVMSVHSASGLPFVNVHFVNRSYKSPRSLWVVEETIIAGEDSSDRTVYWQDTSGSMLFCRKSQHGSTTTTLDSSHVQGLCFDALGLFMMARLYASTSMTLAVPTLNEFAVKETEINFTGDAENIEVAACDKPVRCRRIEGNARWVGNSFAGMNGPFTGWISDDEASIPVRAELKIVLGSIVLELESTNRSDWGPGNIALK